MRATLNEHRSVHAPFTISDDALEFWGKLYLANPSVRARGVSFEQFVRMPWWYLVGARATVAISVRGRLRPATRSALLELAEHAIAALERDGAACANGRFVEKLRHHRHPRSARRDFIPKPVVSIERRARVSERADAKKETDAK
jgi:hypothetical protein